MTLVVCPEFTPSSDDRSRCECKAKWDIHSQAAKSQFVLHADRALADEVIDCVRRDQTDPCVGYWPKEAWAKGQPWPACICGRPRLSHDASSVIKGVKAFKDGKARPVEKQVCGGYYAAIERPGMCVVCDHPWIKHSMAARTLAIEAFPEKHSSWCKCILQVGDVECTCMTTLQIQDALNSLDETKKKETTVLCKRFKSKSPGSTKCAGCDKDFYGHEPDARDGEDLFQSWHASHMTDKELMDFIYTLGKDRATRLINLERMLTDPNYHPPRPLSGGVIPSLDIIKAMVEALTGTPHILSPADIAKRQPKKGPALSASDVTVLEGELLPPGDVAFRCWSCHELTALKEDDLCQECDDRYVTEGTPRRETALDDDPSTDKLHS